MIDLATDVSLDRAVQVLGELATDASNMLGGVAGLPVATVLDRYLAWAEMAERMLRSVLDPDTWIDLLHTTRHWQLGSATEHTPRLIPSVLAELESRAHAINAVRQALLDEQARWKPVGGHAYTIAVPDTTMFLDPGAPFESIDWRQTTHSLHTARVVVPLLAIDELDRLKRQGNSTTAKVAQAAIRWLNDRLPVRPTDRSPLPADDQSHPVTLEVYVEGRARRVDDADLLIIETVRRLGRFADMQATLVTRDLGMAVRARALSVPVAFIPPRPS